jgi:hypothetical protein
MFATRRAAKTLSAIILAQETADLQSPPGFKQNPAALRGILPAILAEAAQDIEPHVEPVHVEPVHVEPVHVEPVAMTQATAAALAVA